MENMTWSQDTLVTVWDMRVLNRDMLKSRVCVRHTDTGHAGHFGPVWFHRLWGIREDPTLRSHPFLMHLLDVCFNILVHANKLKKLATRMVLVGAWFAPYPIPISLLSIATQKAPERASRLQLQKKCMHVIGCCCTVSQIRKSIVEASTMLIRFGIARSSTKQGWINMHEMIQLYAKKKGGNSTTIAMFQGVGSKGAISLHSEHLWAACFLVFGFVNDPVIVEPKVSE